MHKILKHWQNLKFEWIFYGVGDNAKRSNYTSFASWEFQGLAINVDIWGRDEESIVHFIIWSILINVFPTLDGDDIGRYEYNFFSFCFWIRNSPI